jgi:chemotaxis regulatin CheY-phosphate phosphatase CheZ
MDTQKENQRKDLLAEARRLLDEAKPKVSKAVEDAKPRLSRAVEQAKPHLSRAVDQARPRIEKTAKDSLQFVQDHESELKQAGGMLLRTQIRGPLRYAVDAFVAQSAASQPQATPLHCPSCDFANPASARFCSSCGSTLSTT